MPHPVQGPSILSKIAKVTLTTGLLSSVMLSAAARADDRCQGTFCDLYYGNKPQTADGAEAKTSGKTSDKTVMTVPSFAGATTGFLGRIFGGSEGSSSADAGKKPLFGIGGGGVAAAVRGESSKRCEGTLCDLYYGGPPPKEPEAPANQVTHVTAAAAPDEDETDMPAADPGSAAVVRARRAAAENTHRCISKPGDPWGCYR